MEKLPNEASAGFRAVLGRVLRRRCPRCGRGALFEGWYRERAACAACGLEYERRGGDTWAFMYATTAVFVAPVVLFVLVLRAYLSWLTSPALIGAIVLLMVATLPLRKAVAVGVDYLIESRQPAPGSSENR